jgi:hypothetical protein
LQLLPFLAAAAAPDGGGYRLMTPEFKAREYRQDGVFLAVEQASELSVLVLEAQMRADPEFILGLYAESGRLLPQQYRQGRLTRQWQVVLICPLRTLSFGDPEPVAEFLERRVLVGAAARSGRSQASAAAAHPGAASGD